MKIRNSPEQSANYKVLKMIATFTASIKRCGSEQATSEPLFISSCYLTLFPALLLTVLLIGRPRNR
jgi:hypothetical protein